MQSSPAPRSFSTVRLKPINSKKIGPKRNTSPQTDPFRRRSPANRPATPQKSIPPPAENPPLPTENPLNHPARNASAQSSDPVLARLPKPPEGRQKSLAGRMPAGISLAPTSLATVLLAGIPLASLAPPHRFACPRTPLAPTLIIRPNRAKNAIVCIEKFFLCQLPQSPIRARQFVTEFVSPGQRFFRAIGPFVRQSAPQQNMRKKCPALCRVDRVCQAPQHQGEG